MTARQSAMFNVFTSWRMFIVLLIGFSSGVPLALTANTLQAWMKSENVDLANIGLASLIALPYAFKFLWSPLMDHFVPPLLGRRRGWMLLCQLALAVGIAAMAFLSPGRFPVPLALLATFVAFFSASQDIVIDAYRTEILEPRELGAGSGVYVMGYRVAMLVSGGLTLILADHVSWQAVYLIMAGAMAVGMTATLLAPEPKLNAAPPKTLLDAVVLPFVEFLRRKGALEILLFIFLYKIDVFIAQAMVTPFLMDIGFSKTDIGTVSNMFGMVSVIVGGLLGGLLMVRWGLYRSLWVFGLLQGLSGLAFTALAAVGNHYVMFVVANVLENLCIGMGISAFTAFLMSLCDKRFTATQFALLSSLMALSRTLSGATTGFLSERLIAHWGKNMGWGLFFLIATVAAVPGLLLLFTRYRRWGLTTNSDPESESQPATAAAGTGPKDR